MSNRIQSVRGMNDVLPDDSGIWLWLEDAARAVMEAYGYRQIRMPLVERTQLFSGALGESTDIVGKEMYTFEERAGDYVSLRPEGTASCVRALIQHGLLQGQSHRLWYSGPMFRRERPQRGRLRQFHQIGAEAFGLNGPDVDAELVMLTARLWRRLGLEELRLEINTLGSPECRRSWRTALVDYFQSHEAALDEHSKRRLTDNPLRILDSKNPQVQALAREAPSMTGFLDDESAAHYDGFKALLDEAEISYRENPHLVRGLDYYTRTVFEWQTDKLGAQSAVCAGGRYDGLVAAQGGPKTPAVGFAMGLERLIELMRQAGTGQEPSLHAYVVLLDGAQSDGWQLAEAWREACPGLRLQVNAGGGSAKAQLRRADKCGAEFAVILGESELAAGVATLKPLRGNGGQRQVGLDSVAAELMAT